MIDIDGQVTEHQAKVATIRQQIKSHQKTIESYYRKIRLEESEISKLYEGITPWMGKQDDGLDIYEDHFELRANPGVPSITGSAPIDDRDALMAAMVSEGPIIRVWKIGNQYAYGKVRITSVEGDRYGFSGTEGAYLL